MSQNQQEQPAPPTSWYQRAKSSAMGATSAAGSAISGTASSAYNAVGNVSQKATHSVRDAAYNATHDFTDNTHGTIDINKDITNVIVAKTEIKRQCLLYVNADTASKIVTALREHISGASNEEALCIRLTELSKPGRMSTLKERLEAVKLNDIERQQQLMEIIKFTQPLPCNVSDGKVTTGTGIINVTIPGVITEINPSLKRLTFKTNGKLNKTGDQIEETVKPSHCSFANLCISTSGLADTTDPSTNMSGPSTNMSAQPQGMVAQQAAQQTGQPIGLPTNQLGGHYDDLSNSVSFNDFIGGKLSATSDDNICE
jgi:hypothetical protein